jgi:hypothetical protein
MTRLLQLRSGYFPILLSISLLLQTLEHGIIHCRFSAMIIGDHIPNDMKYLD